jgi:hypothetical protein
MLRAKLRWFAAHCNRCDYAKAYARADFLRAGGRAPDLDELPGQIGMLPEEERLALQLVQQLVEAAYTVTDAQIARLIEIYGTKGAAGIVLVAAYASFQDRLLLALGVSVEPDGPLPPVKARFRKPPDTASSAEPKKDAPQKAAEKAQGRKLSPPAKNPPPVPEKVDDPQWAAIPFEKLQSNMLQQIARRQARLPIPDAETVLKGFPVDLPHPPDRSMRIRWSRLCYGYQPRLTAAWLGGLAAFHEDSDLDEVFHESMFWVVTRSSLCFY